MSTGSSAPTQCPLCQAPIDSSDELQLHYLTSCSGYDKAGDEPRSKLEQRDTTSGVEDMGPVETVPTDVDVPVGGAGGVAGGGASATAQPPEDSIVQFMWQPLTDMSYPKVTLLASFKSGSVDLLLDVGGGHYASKHVTIPRGVYEGQLVVGDSFVHPVQKFEVESDGVVVLQFESSHHHDDSQYGYSSSQYGTGYMQSNPSYNINSGGGTSKYSNYSTGAYHDRAGGRYGSTGSRQQYGDMGGYQTTENVSYYQRYQDSAGYESRRSQVNDQQMHTSTTAQTPLMQAASIQEPYGDGYFQQLSKEEFSPEPVKSKLGTFSTSVPDNTRSATLVTGFDSSNTSRVQASHPPSQSMAQPSQTNTGTSPRTVSISDTPTTAGAQNILNNQPESVSNSGEFNVGQLQQEKQDMAVDYERQLLEMKEQLQAVTSERDELKQNQERLNAHWESQVRRLEQQLQKSGVGEQPTGEYYDNGMTRAQLESAQETITQLENQLSTLKRQRSRESQMGREAQAARDLEKELNEVKDRNAALQSQLTEYAGVISDQSKVIQSGKVQDSEYVHLQQHHIHLGEYLKKQQLEYEEALSSLKKKISNVSKLGDENLKIHQLNVNLTAELEDYRTQTKRLLADLRQKDSELAQRDTELAQRYAELAQRDAEIGQLREQRGYYSSSSSDRDQMELDMLRQKCDAWREEVEKLAPLRDEVGRLHAHIDGLGEQIRSLQTNNESLGKQLQSVVEESERKQMETYRKAPPDYDNIRSQLAELQQIRVQLEKELFPLREERARILTENARLREGTQPEKYANLKENYDALDDHCGQLEKALEEERTLVKRLEDTNSRMQAQLSEATNPDQLQTIRTRMERYRQERDAASKQVDELQEQLEMHKAENHKKGLELYQATEASESYANQVQEQLAQYQQEASTLASKAQDYESRMRRYREERNQAQSANKGLQEQIKTLQTTVQDLTSQLQSQHQVAASLTSMESGVFETGDYSPQQPLYTRESPTSPTSEDLTTSPTLEQYSPYKYTTGDDQYREDVVPKAERSRKTQQGDNRHLGGGHWSHSSSSASLASSGGENRKQKSRSRSSGGYQLTNVRTKDGQVATYIQKPPMPLSPKEKPRVIVKRSDGDFETGTLMHVGMINQKEMAGVQLDIRMPRPRTTGSSSTYSNTDGTCEIDGKRHFKCPSGFGVYVPISKVYVEADFDSATV